jgi:hypothetical protein
MKQVYEMGRVKNAGIIDEKKKKRGIFGKTFKNKYIFIRNCIFINNNILAIPYKSRHMRAAERGAVRGS